ncbi:MAG: hypothetical protein M1835_004149 [Candelina submexicana]|nr:MAG: hypothetical protein M1835_004149 [Candelina submexicana]
MSRRVPNPAADRAAQNQQTIKSLLKLEGNKSCADCKRNKHPRWASWNLGIFVCIRCSGIHRGMGTHISRVKSVDLDAWTDEQLQSVLRWGNSRANKYWEAKLAPGHVPSEAKLENFIRTKYEAKRWVMDGGIPDPATLDTEGDDDVPLNVVQEKAKLDRSTSQRVSSSSSQPAPPASRSPPNVDLFGDDPPSAPARPSTTTPAVTGPSARKPDPPPPKASKPGDSLLGLDFFGNAQSSPPARPSSATSVPVGSSAPSRPDLKQSILSLYASAPRQPSQPQVPQAQTNSFGGMQSPPIPQQAQPSLFGVMQSPPLQQSAQSSSGGGLDDAFGGLSFASPTSPQSQQQPSKPSPFANLGNFSNQRSTPAPAQITSPSSTVSGGGFFNTNTKPAQATKPPSQQTNQAKRTFSSSSGFGGFSSATGGSPLAPKITQPASAGLGDMFDFSGSSSPPPTPPKPPQMQNTNSAFNLSATAPPAQSKPQPAPKSSTTSTVSAGWSNTDAWGSNDVWRTPDAPAAVPKAPAIKSPPAVTASANDFGWGSTGRANKGTASDGGFGISNTPEVSLDEDFGDWGSAPPANAKPASSSTASKPVEGFTASEDLFSNVWE